MLLLVIAAVAFIDHSLGVYKHKRQERKLRRFLARFDAVKHSTDYKDLLKVRPDSINSLLLLASIYYKSGEYGEAMNIYLALLDILANKTERVAVMTLLARAYYKAGFFMRSRDILLESLRLKARNRDALELLLVIYEQLREYKRALEVLESLEEMEVEVQDERVYLAAHQIIGNAFLSIDEKHDQLLALLATNGFLLRICLEFALLHFPNEIWTVIIEERLPDVADLFWRLPEAQFDPKAARQYAFLCELYSAKGWLEAADSSGVFEFDVLIKLGEHRKTAVLEFEYQCKSCMAIYPVHFHRCPNCLSSAGARVGLALAKNTGSDQGFDANGANFL